MRFRDMKTCQYCGADAVEKVQADPPWTDDHYQCVACDSTFNNVEFEDEK
jgi:transposase-like protein